MGYKPERKLYTLKFDDHPGLVVRARSCSTKVFFDVAALADLENPTDNDLQMLFKEFSNVLMSWNLEDEDDQPVPVTLDGLLSQEFDFVMEIIQAWMEAVGGVSTPLEPPSKDGAIILMEASIPMAPLTENQAS
jgi:hypothetical protein